MKYWADFETANDKQGVYCRMIGVRDENDQYTEYLGEHCMTIFIKWLETLKSKDEIFFHNLSFDGWFLISKLIENKYLPVFNFSNSIGGVFMLILDDYLKIYCISLKTKSKQYIKIKCSLMILGNQSVARLGKALGKEKLDTYDYTKLGYEYTKEERDYLKRDTEIPKDFMNLFYKTLSEQNNEISDKIEKKLTIGGISKLICMKEMSDNVPTHIKTKIRTIYDLEEWLKYKDSYRGGIVVVNNDYRNVVNENVYTYDVNSMYPWAMRQDLPYKKYHNKTKTTKELFKVRMSVRPRENTKSIFLIKVGKKMVNYVDNLEMWIWEKELEVLKKFYEIDYTILEEEHWHTFPLYKSFVDKYYLLKQEASKNKNTVEKEIWKLILNSAYGKLGECPLKESVYFSKYSKEKLEEWAKEKGKNWRITHQKHFTIGEYKLFVVQDNDVLINSHKGNVSLSPVYQAGYITMLARCLLMETMLMVGIENVIYGDTDSLKLKTKLPDELIDNDELGKWKFEGLVEKFIYRRKKMYAYFYKNKWEYHFCGFNNRQLEINKWDPCEMVYNNDIMLENAKKIKDRQDSGIWLGEGNGVINAYDFKENSL